MTQGGGGGGKEGERHYPEVEPVRRGEDREIGPSSRTSAWDTRRAPALLPSTRQKDTIDPFWITVARQLFSHSAGGSGSAA